MGCFNGTCVITNLPIVYREPTVLIPIAFNNHNDDDRRRDLGGLVYATDAAYPLTFGVEGTYDDYGSIEKYDEKNISVKVLLHGIGCKSFGDFLSEVHEGEIKINKGMPDESYVGYVLAHKRAFDFLAEQFGREEDYKQAKSIIQIKTDSLKDGSNLEAIIDKYGKDLDKSDLLHVKSFKYAIPIHLGGFELRGYDHILSDYIEKNPNKAKKKRDSMAEDMATLHMKLMAFVSGMNCLRRSIFPPCGAGSQSSHLKSQMKLNNIVSEILATKIIDKDMNEEGMSYVYNIMLGDEDH